MIYNCVRLIKQLTPSGTYPIAIGFDSSGAKYANRDFGGRYNTDKFYTVGSNGMIYSCNSYETERAVLSWKNGDIVSFALDVKQDGIKITLNNSEAIEFARNINLKDKTYNLGIALVWKTDQVEPIVQLTDFQISQH